MSLRPALLPHRLYCRARRRSNGQPSFSTPFRSPTPSRPPCHHTRPRSRNQYRKSKVSSEKSSSNREVGLGGPVRGSSSSTSGRAGYERNSQSSGSSSSFTYVVSVQIVIIRKFVQQTENGLANTRDDASSALPTLLIIRLQLNTLLQAHAFLT